MASRPKPPPRTTSPSPRPGAPVDVPEPLLHAVCEEVGLDPHRDAREVLDALRFAPERECCDSGCDPCVLTIARAAELVKRRLRLR